jgi:hypothetical protein
MQERENERLHLAGQIARVFYNFPSLPHAVIEKAHVRNPKDRFPDAGKLLAALPKPSP